MIIQCDQCKSRFKLADDKVSSKGVRVRCTKCQHTFVVRQSMEAAVAAAKAAKALGETAPAPSAAAPSLASAVAPTAPASGEAPSSSPSPSADAPSLDAMFGAPGPVSAADAPEGPAITDGASSELFDGPAFTGVDPSKTQALFGDLDLGLGDSGYDPPLPVAPPSPAPPAGLEGGADDLDLDSGFEAPQGLAGESDNGDLEQAFGGPASDAEARAAIDAAAELDLDAAFGVSSPGDAGAGETAAPEAPPGTEPSSDPTPESAGGDSAWSFDFQTEAAPEVTGASEEAASIAVSGEDAGGGFEDWEIGSGDDGVPAFDPAGAAPSGLDLGGTPSSEFFEPGSSGGDDPFASLEFGDQPDELGADAAEASGLEASPGADLFGSVESPDEGAVPGASAATTSADPGVAVDGGERAELSSGAMRSQPARPAPTPIPHPAAGRGLGPLLMNGAFVASLFAAGLGAFVATRTEGGVDATLFSPARIEKALGGGERGIEVTSTVPGIYPRPGQSAVVYVRGTVRNGGTTAIARPKVTASLTTASGDVLGTVQAVVGVEPDAADLSALKGRAELAALEARLSQQQDEAELLAPGATLPYFAVFLSAPDDPRAGLRFEVRPAAP